MIVITIRLFLNELFSPRSFTLELILTVSENLLDKKICLFGLLSMNNTYGLTQSRVYSARVNTSYSVKRKHNFNLSLSGGIKPDDAAGIRRN